MKKKMRLTKVFKVLATFLFIISFLSLASASASAQGHFEFNFHYGRWSINLLRPIIENMLNDALENHLKKNFLEDIQANHPELAEKAYSQNVRFDSSGDNYGVELRWYPGGENGSFSLGLAVEKTTMKVGLPELSADLELENTINKKIANFSGKASGEFLIKPLSFHLSFRWDIFPSSPVHPLITFGVGASGGSALEQSTLTYNYQGRLKITGEPEESYSGGDTKSLKQLKDEREAEGNNFPLPGFFPFVQLDLGLKVKVSRNFHLWLTGGIWDGFLVRGGLSLRL
ncbi:MAG: hypothetical protein N3B16_01095 [Candidatus Aminicenantes bacterium]|nr:hypothetical protein [Candidatus Aminicenantes bacterium]